MSKKEPKKRKKFLGMDPLTPNGTIVLIKEVYVFVIVVGCLATGVIGLYLTNLVDATALIIVNNITSAVIVVLTGSVLVIETLRITIAQICNDPRMSQFKK